MKSRHNENSLMFTPEGPDINKTLNYSWLTLANQWIVGVNATHPTRLDLGSFPTLIHIDRADKLAISF